MRCSKCGTDNREGARFCDKCGGKFSPRCASCGAENRTDAKFCDSCGAALGAEATGAAPGAKINDTPIRVAEISAAENLEGERKTVTALFADIKGSTELQQDLDPEESRAIIDPALKIMIDAARRYDGYVQSTGDGIFALFGAPLAHEDHPQRAVHAALRMQREIRRYGDQLLEAGGVPIEIRVGVNTGEVVMRPLKTGDSHIEYAPIGHTTNLASRMQAVARSGSVVVSEATRKLVEGYFQLKSIGPTRVKGVNEPVHVYEVTGLGPLRTRLQRSASRGYTKFVGRQREMETMEQAAELAKTGHGQIVAAVAEPGVGKSRLLYEFKAKHQSGWIVLEALSVSHGKASAYLPMIDLLHGYFGIRADDDQRTRREKVNGRIVTLDPDLEDTRAYLFGLLGLGEGDDPLAGMDAQIRRQRTLEALKRILLRESLNQPLMVVFEDLHWIDDETQAFLNLLADSIDSAKVLLAVNYRPEYSHQWGSKSYYTELRLDPLGGESAQEMLSSLLGDGSELSPLKGLILGKTEGNPLFMEEIVQALYEEGTLAHDGAAHLTRPLDALKVPTSVQAVLAARIDRLPAKEKESLQMLAVVGTEFPLSLVRAMSERASESELDRTLEQLQLADFIYEQPAAGDIEYTFKHALTQEVAYNSVLHERRKALHERIGAAIESLYADSLDDHVAELARHYGRSNRGAKAAHYLHLAAIQAQQRGAFGDAVALTRRGLTALETMGAGPERDRLEIPLQLMLGQCLGPVLSPTSSELAEAYARAIELAERVGDQGQLFAALTGRATYFVMTGDVAGMQGIDQLLLTMAKQSRNPAMLGTAHAICASSCLWSGDLAGAKMHGEATLAVPGSEYQFGPLFPRFIYGLSALCSSLWLMGFPDRAHRVGDEMVNMGRAHGSALAKLLALINLQELYRFLREPAIVRERTESAAAIAAEYGIRPIELLSNCYHGWSLVQEGCGGEGLAELRHGLEGRQVLGIAPRINHLAMLAEAHLKMRQPEEGLAVVEDLFVRMEKTRAHIGAAEGHQLKGELLLLGDPADMTRAEREFRDAIDIARKQDAKSFELRATTGLARLLRDTNRRDEARAMLAEIYGWFIEGFDTADLKDAKALLVELGA